MILSQFPNEDNLGLYSPLSIIVKKKKIHEDIIQLYTLVINTTMHDMMYHLVFINKYHENS